MSAATESSAYCIITAQQYLSLDYLYLNLVTDHVFSASSWIVSLSAVIFFSLYRILQQLASQSQLIENVWKQKLLAWTFLMAYQTTGRWVWEDLIICELLFHMRVNQAQGLFLSRPLEDIEFWNSWIWCYVKIAWALKTSSFVKSGFKKKKKSNINAVVMNTKFQNFILRN